MTYKFHKTFQLICSCMMVLAACSPLSKPEPQEDSSPTANSTAAPAQPEWSTFSPAAEILAEGGARTVAVAPDGTIWLGTNRGPYSYNGTSWEKVTAGLPSIRITSLQVGPAGGIWASTTEGITRLSDGYWARLKETYGRNNNRFEDIAIGPDGALWFAGLISISRFDGGEAWDVHYNPLGEEGPVITALAIAPNGDFWFGTHDGTYRLEAETQTLAHFTTADGLPDNHIKAIFSAPDGSLWFGTPSGAARYDGETWTTFSTQDDLIGQSVEDITAGPDGNLWLLTDRSLNIFRDPKITTAVLLPTSLCTAIPTYTPAPTRTTAPTSRPTGTPTQLPPPLQRVVPVGDIVAGDSPVLYSACDGSLWLITGTAAAMLEEDTWIPVLSDISGTMAGIDAQGMVWVVRENGTIISGWNGSSWTEFGLQEGWQPLEEFSSIRLGQCGPDGRFWLATTSDVRSFNDQQWTIYSPEDMGMEDVASENWTALQLAIQQKTGNVWVGGCNLFGAGPTGGPGARWFDGEHWLGLDSPASDGCVAAIVEDAGGDMWLGVDELLWHVSSSSGEWTSHTPPEVPFGYRRFGAVTALAPDSFGGIWAAELMCGGACCDSLALYQVQNNTWTLQSEKETWVSDLSILSNPSGSWLFADAIYHLDGTGLTLAAPLYPQTAGLDSAGGIWFLIQDYPQPMLCTIDT
ncbi:MAG: hypothetical protein JXA25_14665 [Anaerolineales bacterium]|nr:hypothetical protein [Anaerolineales bacterium]